MGKFDKFFTKRELFVIEQPNAEELVSLCCTVSGGKFWATDEYLTDRSGYGRMLFIYVNEGEMQLEYYGQKYIIKKGEAFFIDCDPHHVYGTHGKSCVLTFIHFMGGQSEYFFKTIMKKHCPVYKGYGAKLIKSCIEEIASINLSHMQNKVERYCAILTNTLFSLLTLEAETDPVFEKAAMLIREAVAQNITISVKDIAQKTGYSKYYFTRRFTELIGISPYEYIMREKMAFAKNLLINTSEPICEIALACGFYDASHMTNFFKKREGTTPIKYRSEWKRTI